jgi:hypothetical protein
MTIEVCLTLFAAAIAYGWPACGARFFGYVEKAFARLARRRMLAVVVVGLAALCLRLAILPLSPSPQPFVPDDFSFLLAADTFASGRLTNPTPELWTHFESIHICMQPTYMSMYFPAQGLVLATAKVLTGQAWFGVLLAGALMCASLCWMLQAWLPPSWALLGGMLAVLRIVLFSCWVNSYHTAGTIAALGGALALGALPRFLRSPQLRYTLLLAIAAILLAYTRPYEGLLLSIPITVVLFRWAFVGKDRPHARTLLRLTAAPLALVILGGAWMAYYNYRVFGSPLTLPYIVNRSTYAMAPYFVWQSPRPEPVYRHAAMRTFYYENELAALNDFGSKRGFVQQTLWKMARGILFFSGVALLLPLVMFRHVLLDHRVRFLVDCLLVMTAGMVLQIFFLAYYIAPFTAVFYALGLQAMRHLRAAKADGLRVGQATVRMLVTLCVVLCGVRLLARPLNIDMPQWPASAWNFNWYGPADFGKQRAQVEATLEQFSGRHLVIVRYASTHNPLDEWVYNAPDIEGARVIWAREMSDAENLELIRHYSGRRLWLAEPDARPRLVEPYAMSGQIVQAAKSEMLNAKSESQ